MNRIFIIAITILILINSLEAKLKVRLKNIVTIQGIRENQIIGYGIVTGLNGTGDSRKFKPTQRLLSLVMENLGIDTESDIIYSKNSALVIVTAKLPETAQKGEMIDVEVSSIGDSKSIVAGVLLQSPLRSADGTVYAVAQGNITVSDTERKNLTTGIIPNGAIVEKQFSSQFIQNNKIILSLKYPDFGLVNKVKEAILEKFKDIGIMVLNNKAIEIAIPEAYRDNYDKFITEIMVLEVEPEPKAKIVINKNSGVIVISGDVKLSEAAVSYKNTDVYIKKRTGAYTAGAEERKEQQIYYLEESGDIKTLVDGLNKIGAKTEDIIAILYSLKKANALYGEIIVE